MKKGDVVSTKNGRQISIKPNTKFIVTEQNEENFTLETNDRGVKLIIPNKLASLFEFKEESWSEWRHYEESMGRCCDCSFGWYCNFSSDEKFCSDIRKFEYRTKGREIQVRKKGKVASVTCHPEDKYDFKFGLRIAILRLNQILINDSMSEMIANEINKGVNKNDNRKRM